MEVQEIKKSISVRPFRSFEIDLDNGEVHLVTHPEIIISKSLIVTINENGETVFIAPEAVSSIKFRSDSNN